MSGAQLSSCRICWYRFIYYLPFCFTIFLIVGILSAYSLAYIIPYWDHFRLVCAATLSWLSFWLLVSLIMVVFTPPGSVPINAENEEFESAHDSIESLNIQVKKYEAGAHSPKTQFSENSKENDDQKPYLTPRFRLVKEQKSQWNPTRSPMLSTFTAPPNDSRFALPEPEENEKLINLIRFRTYEKDKQGYSRFCKFCLHSKPDRAHHCKVCGTCVLKMDHHCPWIINCVGFRNYKPFMCLIFYSGLATALIALTFWKSVLHAMAHSGFLRFFMLSFIYLLTLCLAILLNGFFFFHLSLTSQNYTTIQFCEKRKEKSSIYYMTSPFSRGLYKNLKEVLGNCWLSWLLPCPIRKNNDGLEFEINEIYKEKR